MNFDRFKWSIIIKWHKFKWYSGAIPLLISTRNIIYIWYRYNKNIFLIHGFCIATINKVSNINHWKDLFYCDISPLNCAWLWHVAKQIKGRFVTISGRNHELKHWQGKDCCIILMVVGVTQKKSFSCWTLDFSLNFWKFTRFSILKEKL